jgi:DNA repair protein RadC
MTAIDHAGPLPGLREQGPVPLWTEPSAAPHVGTAVGAGHAEAHAPLARLLRGCLGPRSYAVAEALLQRFGSLSAVLAASEELLGGVPGMSPSAAQLLLAAHELLGLASREAITPGAVLGDRPALEHHLRARLRCRPRACLLGLFLDRHDALIRDEVLGEGSLDQVPVYPAELVRRALHHNAAAVILARNEPSGCPAPTQHDIAAARQLAWLLAALGIALHDHVVVGHNAMISLRQQGHL